MQGSRGSTPGGRRAGRVARLRLPRGRADRAGLVAARASPRPRSRGCSRARRRRLPTRSSTASRCARAACSSAGRSSSREYPAELAAARIEEAALTWGGYAPEGMLTVTRPGERLALVERMVDDATRVLQIVYALNRVWPPTTKRVASRAEGLPVKPERLAERIEEALTEPDPFRALLVLNELQLETVDARAERPERRPRPRLARTSARRAPDTITGVTDEARLEQTDSGLKPASGGLVRRQRRRDRLGRPRRLRLRLHLRGPRRASSSSSGSTSTSSSPASRSASTTRRARRRTSSCSPASACCW